MHGQQHTKNYKGFYFNIYRGCVDVYGGSWCNKHVTIQILLIFAVFFQIIPTFAGLNISVFFSSRWSFKIESSLQFRFSLSPFSRSSLGFAFPWSSVRNRIFAALFLNIIFIFLSSESNFRGAPSEFYFRGALSKFYFRGPVFRISFSRSCDQKFIFAVIFLNFIFAVLFSECHFRSSLSEFYFRGRFSKFYFPRPLFRISFSRSFF